MATSTLKSTGGDYSSIVAWESAKQGILSEPEILECYKGTTVEGAWQADGSLNEALQIAGWTTTAANNIVIQAAAGEEHNGVLLENGGNGFKLISTTAVSTVELHTVDLVINDIEIEANAERSALSWGAADLSVAVYLNRVIVNKTVGTNLAVAAINCDTRAADIDLTCTNCLILSTSRTVDSRGPQKYYNCIFDGGDMINIGASIVFTNVLSISRVGSGWYGNNGTATNCAANDGTAFGTSPVQNVSTVAGVDLVDPDNKNYNVVASGVLDGAGFDNTAAGYTDDIAGNTRSVPWEIGAYEIAAAGGVTFDGPDIVAQTGTENEVFVFDENGEGTVASRFSVT
jgi:hypothetical protein